MSSKKNDKKGKKSDKDKEKQKMEQQESKRQQQRQQAQKRIQVLQKSGILDAYEYFLRAICKNGLPQANIFQFAAQQILKYQKKMKQQDSKKEQLKNFNKSLADSPSNKRLEKSGQKLKPKQQVKEEPAKGKKK